MRALITGGGGQLASDLAAALGASARAYSHAELDITDGEGVRRAVDQFEPDVIFNCAAFHNVDVCEREPEMSWRVNVDAVGGLARLGIKLVHLSTNYVFDGGRDEPYSENDLPAPKSIYALTKLAGEYAALAYGTDPLVVRSAGLYGLHGSASKGGNFVQRMLGRAQETGVLNVVADQRLQPTFTRDLASAVLDAIEKRATGVLHLVADGECSWYGFTEEIVRNAGLQVPVNPTQTSRNGGVWRPANGVLASDRAKKFGLANLRGWDEALLDYMGQAGLASGRV